MATSTSANTTTRQVGKMTVRVISDLEVELVREFVAPERIVQTFEVEGMPDSISFETLTLTEQDGRTTLRARSRMESIEARDAMLRSGMEAGAAQTYDRLEELLATLSK
ncbi:MAG TPA: SRPBCC domain-containing protein [Vicinamibacterales bacterium]